MRELKKGDRIRVSFQSKNLRKEGDGSWFEGIFSHYDSKMSSEKNGRYGRTESTDRGFTGFFVDSVIFLDDEDNDELPPKRNYVLESYSEEPYEVKTLKEAQAILGYMKHLGLDGARIVQVIEN